MNRSNQFIIVKKLIIQIKLIGENMLYREAQTKILWLDISHFNLQRKNRNNELGVME